MADTDIYNRLPAGVLPDQYFATVRRAAAGKLGEYRLLVAVLEDAIRCYQENARTANRLFRDAEQWIMDPEDDRADGDDVRFSFEYVCGVLNLDPGYLRAGLRRKRGARGKQRRAVAPGHRRRHP